MSQPATPNLPFIHLRVHSAYSLAEGAIQPKDVAKLAAKLGQPAVAVTDTNNMFGALEFANGATDAGVQPIMGLQLDIAHADLKHAAPLAFYAKTERGFLNLQKLSSAAFMQDPTAPTRTLADLQEHTADIICLTGGPTGLLGALIQAGHVQAAEAALQDLHALFGDCLYLELQRHETDGVWPPEAATEKYFMAWAEKYDLPLVATNDCYFAKPETFEAHDALLCIASGRYVVEQDRRRLTPDHYFKTTAEMTALFADVPEALVNTVLIARRCAFKPSVQKPMLPPFPGLPAGVTEAAEMRRQAAEGLQARLGKLTYQVDAAAYHARLEYECSVIENMGFCGYFLIVADFIKWSKANNIPVGPGRGSGAGSVVAWALTITDLDPLRFGLLFERFLNPDRVSMPDFDIDFCQDRRDEVIRYVVQRYGADRVAQIITFGKLQARAVLRDVGRVLQLPYPVVDRICKLVPQNPSNPVTLQQAIDGEPQLQAARDGDPQIGRMINIALQLEGLYRHASTHAAGVVIGPKPLTEIIPVYRDPKSDLQVTQYNMKWVELAGLVKFDFLGLKTLTVLQLTIEQLKARGIEIDLTNLPLDDAKSYALMARGDTMAVFQIEGQGMRDVLRKMQPDTFEDIIALVSLFRPGPMDNIPKYIACKKGLEQPEYLHPKLEPVLRETFGIPVYQEQVMEMGKVLAGYTLGGADLLRRAMGKKIKAEMDAQREIFIKGCADHSQIAPDLASAIFDLIAKFAGYGFNKSHAAAYALIAYQTAYLKANHLLEFMAASMTYDMGDTDKLAVFKEELRRTNVQLLPPDINASYPIFAVEDLPDGTRGIRYALAAIKGVGRAAMEALVAERAARGPFTSMQDLALRCDNRVINKKQLESLIAAGAFDTLHPSRAELFAGVETIIKYANAAADERNTGQENLFGGASQPASKLQLPHAAPWDELEQLAKESAALGFYLTAHPLDSYGTLLERVGVVKSNAVQASLKASGPNLVKLAGIPVLYKERTAKSGSKYAFATLTDAAGQYELMVFSDMLDVARSLLQGDAPLVVQVSVQTRNDETRYVLQRIETVEQILLRDGQGIKLQLISAAAVPKVQQVVAGFKPGKGKLQISVMVSEEDEAVLELPQTYALSRSERLALQAIQGVGLVEVA